MSEAKPPNRLAQETSPYLLQHAYNPVDWYPWGAEALARAKAEDKPIFLSIGYSACHWCHVMERESFEDPAIAALMNERFVNIKVDREERPDIDEIYMKAVIALNGNGGWPMSVFLTPSLEPYFATTYLPPVRRFGRPSFPEVLAELARVWAEEREAVVTQSARLTAHIAEEAKVDLSGELAPDVLDRSLSQMLSRFDPTWGGFGSAPKFPHSGDIRLLLRHHRRTGSGEALHAARVSLDRMAWGGIYDQLGGGFHRYSTDVEWRIPHFEKMLYDNALLIPAYLEGFLVTGRPLYARVAEECAGWVLREMVTPEGGFASAQDADSEGEEGRFFVWTPRELVAVLGEERGRWAAAFYDVTEEGNFEHGKSALWRPRSSAEVAGALGIDAEELDEAMAEARPLLFATRRERVAPATDDKVLAGWNGLMISALCQVHQVLEKPHCLAAAQRAARYVLGGMRQADGRLYATARGGRAHLNACLDDYVFMAQGLLDLYESDFDEGWLREARALCEVTESQFADAHRGGYFTTGEDHEPLIARLKNLHDGALPAATGVQALNLLRLAHLTTQMTLAERAHKAMRSQAAVANQHPQLFSHLLMAVDFARAEPREVVIASDYDDEATQALLRTVRHDLFVPAKVVARATRETDTSLLPLVDGRQPRDESPLAYVCHNFTCRTPVDAAQALRAALA